MRGNNGGQTGGTGEVVLASVALVVAVVALVVALTVNSGSSKSAVSPSVTTTTMSPLQLCQKRLASFAEQWHILDAQRVLLKDLEQRLNAKFTAELAAHSPNVGATDAAHQVALREQADNQQKMLTLAAYSRPCPAATP
jgi:hypothetical protein